MTPPMIARELEAALEVFLDENHDLDLVDDLLLLELDWGDYTPPSMDGYTKVDFQGTTWPVVFSDAELVLRRTLRDAPDGKAILIVPAEAMASVPRDIRARAAHRAVPPLGLRHRLQALTQRSWPAQVDYVDWRPSIARHFDALVHHTPAAIQWAITPTELETMMVEVAFGFEVAGKSAPEILAQLVGAPEVPPTALELDLLRGQLRRDDVATSPPETATLLWAAEEPGRVRTLIRTGVMMGAERWADFVPTWGALNRLRALLVNTCSMADAEAKDSVIAMATAALPHLHYQTRKALVAEAEQALDEVLSDDAYNPWFPSALKHALEATAARLAQHDLAPVERVPQLASHLAADAYQVQLDALGTMASLLASWEAEKPQIAATCATSCASAWATWYAETGAGLDLDALKLMRAQQQGVTLGDAIPRLLKDYWRWRDRLNAAFAESFLNTYEAALHDRDAGVFGLHRLLDWMIKPHLRDGQRVLLLVVDGMGWAACQHLLVQWREQTPPVYAERQLPLLALLPSITSVSRKGLFLGALPTDRLDDEEAYEQKARLQEDRALQAACQGHTVKLYTKSNLNGGQEALNDVQFQGADLVAVVLNAVDDDLKSTTTTVRLPRLEDLGPLVHLAQTSLKLGWRVILTSDHGHTWHRDKVLRRTSMVPGGGARFAPIVLGSATPPGAVITQDPLIIRMQEEQALLLLTATGAYYGHGPRRGYHGGASLEEVVIPCVPLTLRQPPAEEQASARVQPDAARSTPAADRASAGLLLTLSDGRMISPSLSVTLSPTETRLLQALARHDTVSEDELKTLLGTRRIAGPLAMLREKLASVGLDCIEERSRGAGGIIYHLRTELLT